MRELQWRNRLARRTYKTDTEKCGGCEFDPHLEHLFLKFFWFKKLKIRKTLLGASNLIENTHFLHLYVCIWLHIYPPIT